MFVQVPAVMIETLHDWHVPVHAELQQTPSTHMLLKHSLAAAQVEPFSFLQLAMPSHESVPVQFGESSRFAGTFEHVPNAPVMLQALQVSVHVLLQHLPSTQKPLTHSEPTVQVLPRSPLQPLAPLHEPGMHSFSGSAPLMIGPHVPFVPCPFSAAVHAWQVAVHAVLQHVPSTQNVLRHSELKAHAWPFSFLQLPMPSHVFVPMQFGESSTPDARFEHVPMLPAILHAWHVVMHALLQQTPSAQNWLKHSLLAAQTCPCSFLQAPLPSHVFAPMQPGESSTPVIRLVHVPTLPAMLQDWHVVAQVLLQQTPSAQKPLKHSLPTEHPMPISFLHAALPSHEFVPMHIGESSDPEGTFEHIPRLPATLHALQVAVQVESQQTPSAQIALRHSPPRAQPTPLSFLQTPIPSHEFVPEQSAPSSWPRGRLEHVPAEPATLQDLHAAVQFVLQHTPSVQIPLPHWVPSVQG
jgi:hypothetical protein